MLVSRELGLLPYDISSVWNFDNLNSYYVGLEQSFLHFKPYSYKHRYFLTFFKLKGDKLTIADICTIIIIIEHRKVSEKPSKLGSECPVLYDGCAFSQWQ